MASRTALLEALDRIVSVSASHFRAAESGQISLFGEHTGVVDEINLPPVSFEISRREILNWERELIGLYVSDHPLSPVMEDLQDVVTHFSGQLAEVGDKDQVRVLGIITRVRHHRSKAGKAMAFVTMEDLQGTVDLVIFPRTWDKYADLVEMDAIVLVEGRVDNQRAEPKILVDHISTEFSRVMPADPASFTGASAFRPPDLFFEEDNPPFDDINQDPFDGPPFVDASPGLLSPSSSQNSERLAVEASGRTVSKTAVEIVDQAATKPVGKLNAKKISLKTIDKPSDTSASKIVETPAIEPIGKAGADSPGASVASEVVAVPVAAAMAAVVTSLDNKSADEQTHARRTYGKRHSNSRRRF